MRKIIVALSLIGALVIGGCKSNGSTDVCDMNGKNTQVTTCLAQGRTPYYGPMP